MAPRKPSGPPSKPRHKGPQAGGRPVDRNPPREREGNNRPASRKPDSTDRPGITATKLPVQPRHDLAAASGGQYWLFGTHAVTAALANPKRRIHQILATAEGAAAIGRGALGALPPVEKAEREALDRLLGRDAVHQGVAIRVSPLPEVDIYEICDQARETENARLIVLDQVTDPHNVGAILRSTAAFGALAIILTERHAAPESGVLAKAASGALEHVPLARVTNLVRAMGELKEAGFWCLGLAAEGQQTLAQVKPGGRVALCLGAEGSGLRRLTREHCDALVRLPTAGPIGHLNVSNAAAISLYELVR